jgi:cytidyltransferase-like protein
MLGWAEMSADLRTLIKAAYLTQLKHGPFIGKIFQDTTSRDALAELISSKYLLQDRNGSETRYTLSDDGRRLIKVVLAGGVYDVLHVGHLAALSEAKSLGDVLVVVVATDITVETLKGRKPVVPEEDRRALVEGLKPVDIAILGYEDVGFGFEQVLAEVKPDIVAFGYDQENLEKAVVEIIQRHRLGIKVVRLSKFDHEKYASSTLLKQKLSEELS